MEKRAAGESRMPSRGLGSHNPAASPVNTAIRLQSAIAFVRKSDYTLDFQNAIHFQAVEWMDLLLQ